MNKFLLVLAVLSSCALLNAQTADDVYLTKDKNKSALELPLMKDVDALLEKQGKAKKFEPMVIGIDKENAIFWLMPKSWKLTQTATGFSFAPDTDAPTLFTVDVIDGRKASFLDSVELYAEPVFNKEVKVDFKTLQMHRYKIEDVWTDIYILSTGGHMFALSATYPKTKEAASTAATQDIIKSFGLLKMTKGKEDNVYIENVVISDRGDKQEVKFPVGSKFFVTAAPKTLSVKAANRRVYFGCTGRGCAYMLYLERLSSSITQEEFEKQLSVWAGGTLKLESETKEKIGAFDVKVRKLSYSGKNTYNYYFKNGSDFVITFIGSAQDEKTVLPIIKDIITNTKLTDK